MFKNLINWFKGEDQEISLDCIGSLTIIIEGIR